MNLVRIALAIDRPQDDPAITQAFNQCLSTWYALAKVDPLGREAAYWRTEHEQARATFYAALEDWHARQAQESIEQWADRMDRDYGHLDC